MVTERRDMRIQLGVEGANASVAEIDKLARALERLDQAEHKVGQQPSTTTGQGRAVARNQAAIAGTESEPFSKLQAAQAGLVVASRQYADALRKQAADARKYGVESDKALAAQNQALTAFRRWTGASQSLLRVEEQLAHAAQRETRAREAAAASLDRQRTRALAQIAAQEANIVPEAEIQRLTTAPTRAAGDYSDRVFRSREVLADRQLQAEAAGLRLTETINAARQGLAGSEAQARQRIVAGVAARDAANRAVIDAEHRLAQAENAAALVNAKSSQSFRESFVAGFQGERGAPFAQQFGQAAKFSVFYGGAYKALFLLTQTLQNTLAEGIAFEQAMTDLRIATERPEEELKNLADQLSASAVEAGAAPSQGIQTGARSLGLYGVVDSPGAEQDRVARISAQVVSRMAVGSQLQPVDLQGQIAAIAQAFGLGAEGQFRIADLDAYMSKKFGIGQGTALQAVSESATVGIAAGFSPEQIAAMAADMISRTGQSPSAVAGFMAQIFSRGGEGSLTSVAGKYGIDPSQELATVVEQLATRYATAPSNEQAEIAASFGRGKVQNAAIAMLADFAEIQKRAAEAEGGAATGAADKQFEERMKDIGGVLNATLGDLKDFASQLGQTGLLDMFGAAVIAFDKLLESVNGMLRLFNELPRPVRDVIVALGALAVATRLGAFGAIGRIGGAAGIAGTFAGARNASLLASGYAAQGAAGVSGTAAAASAAGAAGVGAQTAGAARGFAAVARLVGPIGLAIGGLLAIGSLKKTSDQMATAQTAATDALSSFTNTAATAQDFRTQADYLDQQAKQSRESGGWLMNAVTFGQGNDESIATANRLEAEAKRLRGAAESLEGVASVGTTGAGAIPSLSADDVTSGLEAMQASGASAGTQLSALRDVLYGTADAANQAAEAFDPADFAKRISAGLQGQVLGGLEGRKGFEGLPVEGALMRAGTDRISGQGMAEEVSKYLTGAEYESRLREGLDQLGVSSAADLDPKTTRLLAEIVGEGVAEQALGRFRAFEGGDEFVESVNQKKIINTIRRGILADAGRSNLALTGRQQLSPEDATALADQWVQRAQANVDALPETDFGGREQALQRLLTDLRTINRRSDGGSEFVGDRIAEARVQLVQVQIDELEALRQAALRNARSRREAIRTSRRFIGRQINRIVKGGGDSDQLAGVLSNAGQGAIALARSALQDALDVARAAVRAKQALARAANQLVATAVQSLGYFGGGGGMGTRTAPGSSKEVKRLEQLLGSLGRTAAADIDSEISTYTGSPQGQREEARLAKQKSDAEKKKDEAKKEKEERDSHAEIAAARARAAAARQGGEIASARAAIAGARAALKEAERGTVEWFDALASLHEAQRSMREALLAYRANLRLLRIDMTNPAKVARAELAAAAAQLRADLRSGAGKDVIAQSRIDVRTARANAEQTAFQQRLDQMQTAEDLGRITHKKYMDYLQHEHNRLESIKHRTFQQQQQLDQVDQLIKEANESMAAQWNFGDIKLPTPYQVRRYIEGHPFAGTNGPRPRDPYTMGGYQGNNPDYHPGPNLTMHVNGADTAKVKQIIREVVGANARINTVATRRR